MDDNYTQNSGQGSEQQNYQQQGNQQDNKRQMREEFYVKGNEVLEKVKEVVQKGNATRIKIKHKEKVLLDIPVTVGAVGAILAPYLAAFGVIAALATQCSLEIEKASNNQPNNQSDNNQPNH